ncbi:MAG: hypothetical protein ACRDOF_03655 [Gaiellaceae bacterium]
MLAVTSLAAAVEPARACSCVPPDPWNLLKQTDGAFVGRLVSRRETDQGRAVLTFSVERVVKGEIAATVEVTTANNGGACGIETSVGRRIGLFLARENDGWVGHLCWQVSPQDLLAAAALPAPNGKGPVALFVRGRFGPARTLALDAKGRTLGYAVGSDNVRQVTACPGGQRIAELVYRGSHHFVVTRELPTFWFVREQRLPRREYGVASLRCVDTLGERLALFSSNPDARGLLAQITPRSVTTLWRGSAFYASFWRNVAYVQAHGGRGTRIVTVDLRTSKTTPLGSVRATGLYELAPNAAGTKLVGDSYEEGCRTAPCAHLVVIDLRPRPISARRIPLPTECCGSAHWIPGDRFAYFHFSGGPILVYTSALRRDGRISGWSAGDGVAIGRTMYGVTRGGTLIRADLTSGKVRVVRRLPGRASVIVAATG